MNIRDLVGPLLLAFGLTLLMKSFWGWYHAPQVNVGFVAPLSKVEQEPLYLEVDFDDSQKAVQEEKKQIKTDYARYEFSNHGACVTQLELLRNKDEAQSFITLTNPSEAQKENRAFLVALDQKTPYYYTLTDQVEDDVSFKVIYTATNDAATIEKTFIIYKDRHELGVQLSVAPEKGQSVRARVLWPSPSLEALKGDDVISALSIDKAGAFVKTAAQQLNERAGFFAPMIFGSQNKYFIHSMVNDTHTFTQRSYYKVVNHQIVSFLEGQTVTQPTTWTLNFYMGPKELAAITPVSQKLEGALEYGFFSLIAKGMLYLLNVCNKYFNNYGFAILFITLLLKLVLLPFTFRGQQKMKKMQEFQKKLAYIQQRYKHNPEELAQAREELIRKHGFPGLGGFLPLLLQIPFFVGLYSALNNSIELYKAPFVFWIKDLSMPDQYYVLPLLIAVSAFLGSVAGRVDKVDFKQVFTAFAIAIFLGAWTANIAAGLALFIFANAFLHVVQTKGQEALGL
jgi:YidC/Oxa1 family membrane protein insertase